ncbi:unnamed protein product [Arctia plantaginis]|uniref:Uncharacterized protein n=1 Tax=Arctia plantaginis TaxID=874455 RepID=A0A8S0ZDN3_ARCPL|nr:unnamed protein product [Arctia plantaginis]
MCLYGRAQEVRFGNVIDSERRRCQRGNEGHRTTDVEGGASPTGSIHQATLTSEQALVGHTPTAMPTPNLVDILRMVMKEKLDNKFAAIQNGQEDRQKQIKDDQQLLLSAVSEVSGAVDKLRKDLDVVEARVTCLGADVDSVKTGLMNCSWLKKVEKRLEKLIKRRDETSTSAENRVNEQQSGLGGKYCGRSPVGDHLTGVH